MFHLISLTALATLFVLSARVILRPRKAALSYLAGPTASSWILGNQAELMQSEAGMSNRRWKQMYGDVYRFQSCYGVEWLVLNDPKAIAHVLKGQTTTFHLEESLREFLRLVTGKGIIYADGPDHARQRRLLQPSFNGPFIKRLTPQFASCASRVLKVWQGMLMNSRKAEIEVDMYHWAECLTMEAIGQTAFGVRFGAIEGEEHELARAYAGFISTAFSQPSSLLIALQALVLHMPPWLVFLTDRLPFKRTQALRVAKASSLAFARSLIRKKREEEHSILEDRDILSILTKAGEEDAKGKFTRMSEEEIYAQLTTFFVAGYETSCNTLTFALYELARHPDVQTRLYTEVAEVLGQFPDVEALEHDALDQMLYLQAVVKETLRLHAVVAHGMFKAGRDDVIPLSKPITVTGGDTLDALPVAKGQRVFLSFDGVNHSQYVWGPDADEFKPERWLTSPPAEEIPQELRCGGPYANLSNFGGGPKTCIAWRFAVVELQTFIAVLVSKFCFKVAPGFSLRREGCSIVVTPTGRGEEGRGAWMPLIIESRQMPRGDVKCE